MPLTTVYIFDARGQFATNVDAASSHDAVRKALAFFLDPFWKRPRPTAATLLRVWPMGGKEGGCNYRKPRSMTLFVPNRSTIAK